VEEIFREIEAARFPVHRVVPIARYGWNDDDSCRANNSSAFNFRMVAGTKVLSDHATGRAVDLNPFLNPYFKPGHPVIGSYDPAAPGTFTGEDVVVRAFKKRGWRWGGDWKHRDYHHFAKK
jgi:peptidoglycan LD-endopeptidase CwlK